MRGRKMKNRSWIIPLFIGAITILIPVLTFSAEVSISVSPIRVEHLVKQGEKGTDTISVTNDGIAPTRLKVSIEDWALTRDGNPMFMKVGSNPYSCGEWIRINPVDFRVDPGQTREVRYTVTVPQGIEDGGFRVAIIFETVPDVTPGEKAKRVYLKGRIATILYEVVGKPLPQGHSNGLKAELKKEGADFILALQNTGKVHFRTKGSITVKDSEGSKALEVELPDVPVLPESEREVKVSYDKPIPKGKYTATAVVDIGKKELIGAETTFDVE
jgi:P pilus assembly chaperone PapD